MSGSGPQGFLLPGFWGPEPLNSGLSRATLAHLFQLLVVTVYPWALATPCQSPVSPFHEDTDPARPGPTPVTCFSSVNLKDLILKYSPILGRCKSPQSSPQDTVLPSNVDWVTPSVIRIDQCFSAVARLTCCPCVCVTELSALWIRSLAGSWPLSTGHHKPLSSPL